MMAVEAIPILPWYWWPQDNARKLYNAEFTYKKSFKFRFEFEKKKAKHIVVNLCREPS